MKTVYVAVCERTPAGTAYGHGTTDILGVFSDEWAARDCIEDNSKDLEKERLYKNTRDVISAIVSNGTEVQYKYRKYDVKQRHVKLAKYIMRNLN